MHAIEPRDPPEETRGPPEESVPADKDVEECRDYSKAEEYYRNWS